jgi:hypothetical protein
MANYIVEKEFESNGLKCVVTFQRMGHRCGYVGVPKEHPLYGKDYSDYLEIKKTDIEEREVSGIFPLIGAMIDEDERVRIEAYFNCHGGITYASGGKYSSYPIESDLWWFGFDCGHCDDGKDLDLAIKMFPEHAMQIITMKQIEDMYPLHNTVRELDYVENECCILAKQLAEFKESEGNKNESKRIN